MKLRSDDLPAAAGGRPVRKSYLVFGSPLIEDAEIKEVTDSMKSGWLGTGPKVGRFERAFADYVGAKHAIAVNSGTAALHLSLLATRIRPGDEVITTPMTFSATAAAIIHAGGKPIFVDIDKATMNIDSELIETSINERTKVLLPVHFAGRPCLMTKIMQLSDRYSLKVVEDAAHAVETVAQGRKVGSIGSLTCFSFYVTKNLVTGEGGMVTTEDSQSADWIKILALHGMTKDAWHRYSDNGFKHYDIVYPGFKYNMMDIQAAIGLHQLQRIESYALRRCEIWENYNKSFGDLPLITPSEEMMPGDRHAYHLYTVLLNLEEIKITRDQFIDALHKENIGAGVHFRALHLHPYYAEKYDLKRGMFRNAEFVSDRTVSLPLSARMNSADVEDVINAVRRILSYYGK